MGNANGEWRGKHTNRKWQASTTAPRRAQPTCTWTRRRWYTKPQQPCKRSPPTSPARIWSIWTTNGLRESIRLGEVPQPICSNWSSIRLPMPRICRRNVQWATVHLKQLTSNLGWCIWQGMQNNQWTSYHATSQPTKICTKIECQIKLKNLLPTLLLRKSPTHHGKKATHLIPIIRYWMNMYSLEDLQGLIDNYERDVIAANNLERSPECNKEKEEEEKTLRIHDHLSKFQCRLSRKLALSNGLGKPHKTPITPLTKEELSRPRKRHWQSSIW
jgi:hypothetical protein